MGVVVEVRHFTKRYGAARGVEALDFQVEAGEIFGFLGPTVRASPRRSARCSTSSGRPKARSACSVSTVAATASRSTGVLGYLPGDLQLFPKLTGRDHVETFAKVRGGVAAMTDEDR